MSGKFNRAIRIGFAMAFVTPALLYTYSMKTKQGQVWSWGFNRNGELGLGSQTNQSFPQVIKNLNFIDIDAKKNLSAGITSDGKLYTWGKNRNGSLGHHPPNISVLLPRQVDFDQKILSISCGYNNICALTQKGNVYVWGIQAPRSSFRTIGTSEVSRQVQLVKPHKVELKNIKQVSCGGDYTSFVNNEGRIFLMGATKIVGRNGAKAAKSTDIIELDLEHITKISSGLNFSLALSDEGKVFAFGNNTYGQLGTGSLKSNYEPEQIQLRDKIIDISCGQNFSGVVTQNGDVYTWGFGNQGQLGHGDKSDQYMPRKIVNLYNQKIKQISCGGAHTALLTESGKLLMMGRGREGQLGRQQKDESNSGYSLSVKQVEQLPPEKLIRKVVCGANHTLILLQNLK